MRGGNDLGFRPVAVVWVTFGVLGNELAPVYDFTGIADEEPHENRKGPREHS